MNLNNMIYSSAFTMEQIKMGFDSGNPHSLVTLFRSTQHFLVPKYLTISLLFGGSLLSSSMCVSSSYYVGGPFQSIAKSGLDSHRRSQLDLTHYNFFPSESSAVDGIPEHLAVRMSECLSVSPCLVCQGHGYCRLVCLLGGF